MSFDSAFLVLIGAMLVLTAYVRFRGVLAEGLYEFYGGRLIKIARREMPRAYWAKIVFMTSACVIGIFMIGRGTELLHF